MSERRRAPSRRAALGGGLATAALAALPRSVRASPTRSLRIADDAAGRPISRFVYGSNEIGAMDGGPPSAALDRLAGVAARRLGGNLMSTYNWVNNAANAGKDYANANGAFLLDALQIAREERARPARVIEAMHETSLALGAASLVTLPLAGFVAADFAGPVSAAEAAPSKRFAPVVWASDRRAADAIDPHVADIPQLLRRLVARYGDAASGRGVMAYALDNEPALWPQSHPRLVAAPPPIADVIARSISAARVIKSVDPSALVFGPVSWGPTEMASFQNAPDWSDYSRHGSFLAAYLDAFHEASERDGRRLLDALDVHWYAFSGKQGLMRSEDPRLDAAMLDAPRTLSERGFREASWVSRALPGEADEGLGLPILPSLAGLCARVFPGVKVAVTEFNYGGAGRLAAGLALADALGRLGAEGVHLAAHWGSLAGWLGEAYRLYRAPDRAGAAFGSAALEAAHDGGPDLCAYASRAGKDVSLVVVNKSERATALDVALASGPARLPSAGFGFDAQRPKAIDIPAEAILVEGAARLVLPGRSARRYRFS